jgi:hypothetical protein
MTLAKAKAYAKAKVKHIYRTGVIYDHHLWSSKYYYIIQATGVIYIMLQLFKDGVYTKA